MMVGRCEQAPVAVVHQQPVPLATAGKVEAVFEQAISEAKRRKEGQKEAKNPSNWPLAPVHSAYSATKFIVNEFGEKSVSPYPHAIEVVPGYASYETYRAHGGYALATALADGSQDVGAVIKAMEDSGPRGLGGLGGAGFPAGRKWRIVREQAQRGGGALMAVNIDEGEPGTFKDRTYLERDPHRFLEFENFWNTKLDDQPGYTVVEIMHKALAPDSDPHKIRGMYIMGENPAMSDPDLNHARHALASLEHLVVQDIFMTETAWLADVVLPATAWPEKTGTVSNTDRMVQLGKQAIDPPGQARPDLRIIQQIANRMGLNWDYGGGIDGAAAPGRPKQGTALSGGSAAHAVASVGAMVPSVYEEMRQTMHTAISGITWGRLQRESSVTYPCLSADDPGAPTVFIERFDTLDGLVNLVPADIIPANERPDADYPFVLITGRQLEHWHTGSMTRRASVLDAIEPMATASLCGDDLRDLGLRPGDVITVHSRRGNVAIHVRRDDDTPEGAVFIPFAYYEAAANLMTNAALDPVGKIPKFKYCAVAVAKGGVPVQRMGYEAVAAMQA